MWFTVSLLFVVEVSVRQVLNENFDIVGEPDEQAVAKILISVQNCIGAKWKRILWDALRGFCPIQFFFTNRTYFFPNSIKNLALREIGKAIPHTQEPEN